MPKQLKRGLPIIAVTGAVVTLITLILLNWQRQSSLVDTGETRSSVEATLRRLQALRPTSLDDAGFRRALVEVNQAPYVADLWIFTPDGSITYGGRGTAKERATAEIRRVLASIPETLLTKEQEGWLLAASAIGAEGEHNDVFNHLLRPIARPDGEVIGMVGVAYDVSPWVSRRPGAGWIIGLLLGLAGLGIYWLALPLWVFLDASERGERAWAWAIFVFIGNFIALIAYILSHSLQHESPSTIS